MPAKAWIMQVLTQKHTADIHWMSLIWMKHSRRNAWTPWLWGKVRWWGIGAPWERLPILRAYCGQHHGALIQSRLAHCPA